MKKILSQAAALMLPLMMSAAGAEIAKPAWAGNNLGKEALSDDYVDLGFPALKLQGNLVSSGTKKLFFNSFALPDKISYKDFQMLNAPACIRLATDKGPVKLNKGALKLRMSGKNAVTADSEFSGGGVRIAVSARVEFDFTVRYSMTIAPQKDPVTIESLAVVFPMGTKADEEKLVMSYKEGPNKAETALEAQGRRIHLTVKGGDKTVHSPGFCSLFWVGTVDWGLSWNFESAKNWYPVKGREMSYDPASGEYAINIIGKPLRLEGKRELSYMYLTPTPVREMPKNWRTWNYGWRGAPNQKFSYKNTPVNQLIWWSSTWAGGAYNPQVIRNPEAVKAAAAEDQKAGMHKANYYIPQLMTTGSMWEADDGNVYVLEDKYLDELCRKYKRMAMRSAYQPKEFKVPADAIRLKDVAERNKIIGGEYGAALRKKFTITDRTYDVVFVPQIADHMLWALNEFIKLGVGGIYFDGINPQATYDSWASWTDEDGVLRPKFHIEYQRQLLKRMRAVVKKNDPSEIIVAHQSGVRPGSTMTLCDAMLPGETLFYWYREKEKREASPNGDFYYAYIIGDIDSMKGEFFYRQWGMPHIFLPEVRGKDGSIFKGTKPTRTMLAYTLHFDLLYFPTASNVSEIFKWYRIRDEYGMGDTPEYQVEFTPYWENKTFGSSDPNVKLSYYDHVKQQELYTSFDITKKYMLIASNLQFTDGNFTIRLPKGLRKVKVREMQSKREIPVAKGTFQDKLEPYDFAIYEITGELPAPGNW